MNGPTPTAQAAPAIEMTRVTKELPGFVLGEISLAVDRGTTLGVIGRNGSGKTTLLQILSGKRTATSGRVLTLGHPPRELSDRIGSVSHGNDFHDVLTLQDVAFIMQGLFSSWDPQRFDSLLRRFELRHKSRIGELSRGSSVKASLAAVLAHNPSLLVLDEITSGLDPVSRETVLDSIDRQVKEQGATVVFSTHIFGDIEKIADSILILRDGKAIWHGTLDQARRRAAECGFGSVEDYALSTIGEQGVV